MSKRVSDDISQAEVAGVRALLQAMTDSLRDPPSLEKLRADYEAMGQAYPVADGVSVTPSQLAGVALEQQTPSKAGQGALLYLHGGGYGIGSPISHRHMVAQFVAATGMTAFVPNYRLAPEHGFPAAVDDAVAVYQALLDQGYAPGNIIIAGDSAGGGLTIATALCLKAKGIAQPAGLFVISPWANLKQEGSSYAAKATSDFIVDVGSLNHWAEAYLAGASANDPLASPVLGDLSGLPPLLIHVGSEEVLLADSVRLAEVAGLAKLDVELKIVPHMPHVFHYMWPQVTAARIAIAEAAHWMKACLSA
ncbi:putative acetyl-hydrolase LipR [Candidatus Phycosocius bacilliformis]|uniref:Putative acetyl-hydrolase LipR n=1 Tax=Candidatus Phycosocius bacilliformis TaxID=1445552 RepID=A0A2P2E6V1_9PROT|nr:alpha/beta hydrolase [Candidatus Phycosocius bacilliformis]GBF56795.1 putative acetyl-hydrolase LipR [Candidatus Phycosocius bacilliformis]